MCTGQLYIDLGQGPAALQMQTTDSLLSELFPGVLQQSRDQPRVGGRDETGRGSTEQTKVLEAKLGKARTLSYKPTYKCSLSHAEVLTHSLCCPVI